MCFLPFRFILRYNRFAVFFYFIAIKAINFLYLFLINAIIQFHVQLGILTTHRIAHSWYYHKLNDIKTYPQFLMHESLASHFHFRVHTRESIFDAINKLHLRLQLNLPTNARVSRNSIGLNGKFVRFSRRATLCRSSKFYKYEIEKLRGTLNEEATATNANYSQCP